MGDVYTERDLVQRLLVNVSTSIIKLPLPSPFLFKVDRVTVNITPIPFGQVRMSTMRTRRFSGMKSEVREKGGR